MSLSPLVSFKSRFVAYLLNFPRTLPALSQFFAGINVVSVNAVVHQKYVKYINELSVCGRVLHR